MEIIPAIDIRGGRCVRLYQGDYARETVFSDDPVSIARRWQKEGATRLHLVDLDGAREGVPVNDTVIREIARTVSVPCQVGGGIRTVEAIGRYLQSGVDRVIFGTAAVEDEPLVASACEAFPGAVVVAVDARGGQIVIRGWLQQSGENAEELMRRLAGLGVSRFVYTDIARDGTLLGPNFVAIERAARVVNVPVIASGGVSSVDHVRRLAEIGVEGVILGRALYEGALTLKDALNAAS
ncbi:MAG: 1-(5-phosphoribosyl)-5-[(5-phosphoribosylamino)methylideneamino]imidazole-4-carboxamide isomerase [Dehalococcoidia bacterium]|nr:1-(5-phosphoribosyl)-5-[(5-phosphoribosylamino)methylideneamino]imidazole-4-carboxamide isomerase [Dehalococcoidia bacterium]